MNPGDDTQNLRRAMRDLLALATMPAAWVGRTPQQVVDGLAELLVSTLRAEACYVRLLAPGGSSVEGIRDRGWPELRAWVERADQEHGPRGAHPRSGVATAGGGELRVAYSPIGLAADGGLVVAASRREDFPGETDWLLLSVAVNQAAVAFQTARLFHDKDKAEAELRRKSRELEDFVENANVGLHWVGADGTILWANQAELEMLGYSAEEYIGRPVADVHADKKVIEEILTRLRRCEALVDFPAQVRHKDGSVREVLINSSVYQEKGRFVHTRCFTLDVTARRRAEREQEKLVALVQHSPDFIGVADLQQRVVFVNSAGQELVGLKADEVPHTRMLDYFPADEGERVEKMILPQLLEKGIWNGEVYFRDFRTEERIPVLWNVFMITDPHSGAPAYFACVSRDMREHKRAEEVLRRSEKLAATGKLAATIAHEINNPIQALTNLLALIGYKTEADADTAALVRLAEGEVRRVGQITRQMLSFHRESKQPVTVRVTDAINDARELMVLQTRGLASRLVVRYKDEGIVEGYPGELRQLFLNLMCNAVEAAGESGRVWVRVSAAREWHGRGRRGIRVLVADNGPGVAPGLEQAIFEPFVTTKEQKGTGLGLWVATGVVQKHHGWLRVRSSTRAGRSGTAFCVFLPASDGAGTEARTAAESAA